MDMRCLGRRGAVEISSAIHGTYNLQRLVSTLDAFGKEAAQLLHQVRADVERIGSKIGKLLNYLPDELLAETMAFACDGDGVGDLVTFSHINRRFRIIAMGMVDVWGTITPFVRPDCVAACLARSIGSALRVQIALVPPDRILRQHGTGLPPYLDAILPTAHRWQSLDFEGPPHETVTSTMLLDRCTELDLPDLERLQYTVGIVNNIEDDVPGRHIYSTWRTPKLREVSFRNVVPLPFTRCSIRSFTLELPKHDWRLTARLEKLQSFLRESPTIEVLRISSLYLTHSNAPYQFPALTMRNVQEFCVHCSFDSSTVNPTMHPFAQFIQSLSLPAVSLFKIQVDLAKTAHHSNPVQIDVSDMALDLLPPPTRCPARMVDIVVCLGRNVQTAAAIFYMPFQRFPSLQELSLQVDGSVFLAGDIGLAFPALKRLSINGCWSRSLTFLREVIYRLKVWHGPEHKLSHVSIKDCSFETKGEALEIVDEDRLKMVEMVVPDSLRHRLDGLGLVPLDIP